MVSVPTSEVTMGKHRSGVILEWALGGDEATAHTGRRQP